MMRTGRNASPGGEQRRPEAGGRILSPLSDREAQVLGAIVECHIESQEPVGSKTLADRSDLRCSPATIRNVMAQLHERDLIAKPHSSAGRVPTTLGLRFFVDCLLRIQAPPSEVQAEISHQVAAAGSVERALDEAGQVLARLSQKACIVGAPRTERVRIRQIDFVRLRDDALLVVLVTAEGLVQNRLLELCDDSQLLRDGQLDDQETLSRFGRYLSERAEGLALEDVRSRLRAEQDEAADALAAFRARAEQFGEAALAAGTGPGTAVRIEGERHLLGGDDPRELARARELLAALDEKSRLAALLDQACEAPGIRVFIGDENPLQEFADMTVVTASYGEGPRVLGSLGVIGPTRMDYARVVPLVEFTAQMVSRLLT